MTAAVRHGGAQGAPLRDERVRVTITDDHEEVDAALRLAHDGFVASGFMAPRPSGRRMIAPFLNPGTAFLVARVAGTVRGTVTLIADGPFGLPADRAFAEEIDGLRAASSRVFEVGALALDGASPRLHGTVAWALIAALVRLQLAEHPDSPGVVAVSPTAERFYRSVVGFAPVTEPRPLLGSPATLMTTTPRAIGEMMLLAEVPSRRRMARLVHGSSMSWLKDGRRGVAWPSSWLNPLLDEVDLRSRVAAQARLALDPGEVLVGPRRRLAVAAPS